MGDGGAHLRVLPGVQILQRSASLCQPSVSHRVLSQLLRFGQLRDFNLRAEDAQAQSSRRRVATAPRVARCAYPGTPGTHSTHSTHTHACRQRQAENRSPVGLQSDLSVELLLFLLRHDVQSRPRLAGKLPAGRRLAGERPALRRRRTPAYVCADTRTPVAAQPPAHGSVSASEPQPQSRMLGLRLRLSGTWRSNAVQRVVPAPSHAEAGRTVAPRGSSGVQRWLGHGIGRTPPSPQSPHTFLERKVIGSPLALLRPPALRISAAASFRNSTDAATPGLPFQASKGQTRELRACSCTAKKLSWHPS
eukprot:SAG11_NODE_4991_length_1700_cov_1.660837_1_plen_306_part_00